MKKWGFECDTYFYVYRPTVRGEAQNAKHENTLSQNSTTLEFFDLLRLEGTLNNFSPIPHFFIFDLSLKLSFWYSYKYHNYMFSLSYS